MIDFVKTKSFIKTNANWSLMIDFVWMKSFNKTNDNYMWSLMIDIKTNDRVL